ILGGAFSAARLKATAMADKTAKISFYRGVRLMGRSDATLALIAGHLVAGPRTMVEKAVDAVNGKQAPRALKALIRKQPRTAGLVFAIPASGAFGADLRNNPGFQNLTAMHGWIRLAGGSMAVKGSVGMDFKSAADAGAQKTALTTAVGQLAQMSTGSGVDLSKGITVTQSGTTARLNGDFASAQVKQVLGLIGAL
ncbi:MAG: hypothetical protein KJO07_05755, partial [Deltaproteobacteria bacterium]|nr:hypothetical protein [Deltaproteobacteria bacterium]